MVRRSVAAILAVLCFAALSTILSPSARAIDLGVNGGNGGGPFRIRCDAGSFMVGLEGHTGAYIDHFRIQCGRWDTASRSITPIGALPITIGTSGGGGPSSAVCPRGWVVNAIKFDLTRDDFVHSINIHCVSPVGAEQIWRTYGPTTPPPPPTGIGATFTANIPQQNCPGGTFAVGIEGRSGLYVDALGLICDALPAAPPPPQPQAIPPNYQPNTTITGKPLGKQAIINTLPPAPTPAPQIATAPPPAPQVRHSGFTGTWDTRTDKNWTYVITLRQDGRNVSGSYVAQNGDRGRINGRVRDNVLEFKWEQDGGFRGSGQFALASDGNSFSGVYTTEPNKKIADPRYLQGNWNGTRR